MIDYESMPEIPDTKFPYRDVDACYNGGNRHNFTERLKLITTFAVPERWLFCNHCGLSRKG